MQLLCFAVVTMAPQQRFPEKALKRSRLRAIAVRTEAKRAMRRTVTTGYLSLVMYSDNTANI
jgi:hypothetical protein